MSKLEPSNRSKRKRRYLFPAGLTKSFRFQIISNQELEELHMRKKTRIYIERRLLKDSIFFEENECRKLPRFHYDELKFGDELGHGQFGRVYEILSFQRDEDSSSCDTTEAAEVSSTSSWPSSSLIKSPRDTSRKKHFLEASESKNECYDDNTQGATQQSYSLDVSRYGYFLDPAMSSLVDDWEKTSEEELRKLDEQRAYLIDHVCEEGKPRYALKRVREDLKDSKEYLATIDLASEAKFLSALSHPNVIQIQAIMGNVGQPKRFGIVMDRLTGTLQEKIAEWRKVVHPHSVSVKRGGRWSRLHGVSTTIRRNLAHCCTQKKGAKSFHRDALFVERIAALADVTRGMKYLHEKRILFRDLKPQNVGRTLEGTYALFDLGLAKELKPVDLIETPDRYNATGLTGSRLFMAPEVATCRPYGFAADVFSFAMMMWEVMSLDDLFPHMKSDKHFERVILGGLRPRSLKRELPPSLHTILKRSWAHDPGERPSFATILENLEKCGEGSRKTTSEDDQVTLFSEESRS